MSKNSLTEEEQNLLDLYNALPVDGKKKLIGYAKKLVKESVAKADKPVSLPGQFTFSDLWEGMIKKIPVESGIYKIYAPVGFDIVFTETSTAPYTGNQLKTVRELSEKWNEINRYPGYEDRLLYIGKSTNLRRRIREFMRTGNGQAINHYGGSSIFQIKDNMDLIVKYYPCENAEKREKDEIDKYIEMRHCLPFANWSRGSDT